MAPGRIARYGTWPGTLRDPGVWILTSRVSALVVGVLCVIVASPMLADLLGAVGSGAAAVLMSLLAVLILRRSLVGGAMAATGATWLWFATVIAIANPDPRWAPHTIFAIAGAAAGVILALACLLLILGAGGILLGTAERRVAGSTDWPAASRSLVLALAGLGLAMVDAWSLRLRPALQSARRGWGGFDIVRWVPEPIVAAESATNTTPSLKAGPTQWGPAETAPLERGGWLLLAESEGADAWGDRDLHLAHRPPTATAGPIHSGPAAAHPALDAEHEDLRPAIVLSKTRIHCPPCEAGELLVVSGSIAMRREFARDLSDRLMLEGRAAWTLDGQRLEHLLIAGARASRRVATSKEISILLGWVADWRAALLESPLPPAERTMLLAKCDRLAIETQDRLLRPPTEEEEEDARGGAPPLAPGAALRPALGHLLAHAGLGAVSDIFYVPYRWFPGSPGLTDEREASIVPSAPAATTEDGEEVLATLLTEGVDLFAPAAGEERFFPWTAPPVATMEAAPAGLGAPWPTRPGVTLYVPFVVVAEKATSLVSGAQIDAPRIEVRRILPRGTIVP
ncbi:MAG: hypothetical protein ACYDDF_03280 [Thermoplasmatota archaeon]